MTLFPKGSSRTSDTPGIQIGSVVMYENDGAPNFGIVIDDKGKKLRVVNQSGGEVSLVAERLMLLGMLPSEIGTSGVERQQFLTTIVEKATELKAEVDIQSIWENVIGEVESLSTGDMCELFFGKPDIPRLAATRLALISDHVYFKRKKEQFLPRSEEVIEELLRAREAEQKKRDAQERTVDAFRARLKDPDCSLPDEVSDDVRMLEDLSASHTEGPESKASRELLKLCLENLKLNFSGSAEDQAFQLLEKLNIFKSDANLSLIRYRPSIEFSSEITETAEALEIPDSVEGLINESGDPKRIDLSHLDTFTIDDASTLDMDDGLSVERTDSGYRFGVHITDVASIISRDSLLDNEAKTRATSLYCPGQKINMFPGVLSEERLSLMKGSPRPCLTYLFETDPDFHITSSKLIRSVISVKRRLTYIEADAFMTGEDVSSISQEDAERTWKLQALFDFASAFEMTRLENGGFKINRRDVEVSLKPDGSFELLEFDEASPARTMVGEMMILANKYSAELARDNNIPVFYRGQETPEEDPFEFAASFPAGPAHDFAVRTKLRPSITSLIPASHSTLGLDVYIQVTSPIRRYFDLCHQRQLLSFLADTPAYTGEELQMIHVETDQAIGQSRLISRESKKYWLLKHLKSLARKKINLEATVVRADGRVPLVELDSIYMTVPAALKKGRRAGDRVHLRIANVNPRRDYLKLDEVKD